MHLVLRMISVEQHIFVGFYSNSEGFDVVAATLVDVCFLHAVVGVSMSSSSALRQSCSSSWQSLGT